MSGVNQIISTPDFPGPVFGTGGNITVEVGASIAGGPTGVYAQNSESARSATKARLTEALAASVVRVPRLGPV